jgi:putative ATPase
LAVYLAAAPKSNSLYLAEKSVKKCIRETGEPGVPFHIRNAPTGLMKEIGYGREYQYPHDFRDGFVKETYLPDELLCEQFYQPKNIGKEKLTGDRLRQLWPERYSKK